MDVIELQEYGTAAAAPTDAPAAWHAYTEADLMADLAILAAAPPPPPPPPASTSARRVPPPRAPVVPKAPVSTTTNPARQELLNSVRAAAASNAAASTQSNAQTHTTTKASSTQTHTRPVFDPSRILHGALDDLSGPRTGFVTCGPSIAAVKTGYGLDKPLIVTGSWTYVWPCIQQCQVLDLRVMTLDVHSPTVYTKQGVPVTITSTAQIKISSEQEALHIAAGQFLGMARIDIARAVVETLEGHQRAIIGGMTVEEVFQDRQKFSSEVNTHAATDLARMGMRIISFTIRDIFDDQNYLNSLGKKRTAEVKRDARIGEAEAERDASTKESEANLERMSKTFDAETAIANSKRDFEMRKAAFDNEVNAEKAKASLAGDLQRAKTQQDIKREQLEADVISRKKQIEIEEQEIIRKEKELEATVRKPAESQRYQMEQSAEAQRKARVLAADGSSQGYVVKGNAEAQVIKATGEAEAEAMNRKADAWKLYTSGAYVDLYIKKLPELVREVSQSISAESEITFISTGGDDVGASRVTGEVIEILNQINPLVMEFTGLDVPAKLAELQSKSNNASKMPVAKAGSGSSRRVAK